MSNLTFNAVLDTCQSIKQKIIYYQVSEFMPKYAQKINGKMTFSNVSGESVFMMIDTPLHNLLLLHPDWLERYQVDIEEQGYEMIEYLGENYELV